VRLRLRYGVRFVVFCLAGEYAYLSSPSWSDATFTSAFACAVSWFGSLNCRSYY